MDDGGWMNWWVNGTWYPEHSLLCAGDSSLPTHLGCLIVCCTLFLLYCLHATEVTSPISVASLVLYILNLPGKSTQIYQVFVHHGKEEW